MRKTKIVCTLGPATNDVETMKRLIQNGMDAARINFSHGTYETHTETITKLKQAREELDASIPLILDTKGPEIRVKAFKEEKVRLEEGAPFTLTTREVEGDATIVSVSYANLPQDVHCGSRVLIDDGLIELTVEDVTETDVLCRVVNGGIVRSRKGVNLPGVEVKLPSLTEKDIADLKFGVEHGFDIVAASFIRSAEDVLKIRKVLEENGGGGMHIISKIENRQGVDNIDKILEVSDGIMVARGDLGVEIPPEEVPLVQKVLIAKANRIGKPVITATQMLESMVRSPRPTRAEANDVANAIFDGSDAIMLSGETAAGAYPLEAVATMARIALKAESALGDDTVKRSRTAEPDGMNITNAISMAACAAAAELHTAAITTVTKSGFTARMISRYRPLCPLIASTSDATVWRQMNLIWGCKPMLYTGELPRGGVFDAALQIAVTSGLLKNGDVVVSALGMPLGFSGATNTLRVDIVGDVLCKGRGIGKKRVTGTARVLPAADGVEFQQGDILVTTATDASFMPYIRKAAAIVVGPPEQNADCHAEVAGSALDIPVIVCDAKVVDFIPSHSLITVDAAKGFVYKGIPKEE